MNIKIKKKELKEVMEAIEFTLTYSEESSFAHENAKGDRLLKRVIKKLKKKI